MPTREGIRGIAQKVVETWICTLTLEANGAQQKPRSGNLMLRVRVGRIVRPVCRRIHVPP
jgi:hypothetical protein